jgi:hypothetical protein
VNPDRFEAVRIEYYGGKLHTDQDIRGIKGDGKRKTYNDLKESYQIAILGTGRYFADEALVHRFEYYDAENRVGLGRRRV